MGPSAAVRGGASGAAPVLPVPAESGDQTPVPAAQGESAGGGDAQGGAASFTLSPAAYGQMLSAQESGAASMLSVALRATGAYAAATALAGSPVPTADTQMPGLPPVLASGRRLDLSV